MPGWLLGNLVGRFLRPREYPQKSKVCYGILGVGFKALISDITSFKCKINNEIKSLAINK